MPELPEVATVLKQITPAIIDQGIADVKVTPKGERMVAPLTPVSLKKELIGRRIIRVNRHGKFMTFELDNSKKVVAHLRMSGRLLISDMPLKHLHNRLHIKFENGKYLNFIDIRRFGTFHLVEKGDTYSGLKKLGPDALSVELTKDYLKAKLKGRAKNIYSTLLDQSIVAGLGNIYVNEVLYASRIHPERSAGKVNPAEIEQILEHTARILKMAIAYRGTTLIDKSYMDTEGLYGDFFNMLKVYGKKDTACERCGTKITRLKIGGRSVYLCETCAN